MAYFIHSLIAITMFFMSILITYIHTCIIYDRTKQLSDYDPIMVHDAYLTIGCFYLLTAYMFSHGLNDVNESTYTPKSQR